MQSKDQILDVIDSASPTIQEKKKPGRPRKQSINISIESHGIVENPINDEDIMELVYYNPQMFKKLFHLYKQYMVSEIEMIYDPHGMTIFTKDHLGKSYIYANIDGRYMNLYYCKTTIRICLKRDNLNKILSALNKNHYKITFVLKKNYRSVMYLGIKDNEYDNEDLYELDVICRTDTDNLIYTNDDTNYPLKFMISSKHFKHRINNINKLSNILTIQKCGALPLELTFDKLQRVNWTGVYTDSTKINLISSIADDDILHVSVYTNYIKPFANSNIGNDVYISVDKKEKISFTSFLDKKETGWACSVKVFTDIKDHAKDDYKHIAD